MYKQRFNTTWARLNNSRTSYIILIYVFYMCNSHPEFARGVSGDVKINYKFKQILLIKSKINE